LVGDWAGDRGERNLHGLFDVLGPTPNAYLV
jgi:hypothetical protein